jgi:hypothetical protein
MRLSWESLFCHSLWSHAEIPDSLNGKLLKIHLLTHSYGMNKLEVTDNPMLYIVGNARFLSKVRTNIALHEIYPVREK